MRVLVLHSQVPFASGGAEVLVHGLVDALRVRGHDADLVALPYSWNPPDRLLNTAMAWRMLDLRQVAGLPVDMVICTKFPTWAADHPRKVLWLVHQHRQAYDLAGTQWSEFGPDRASRRVQRHVFEIDRVGIGECVARYAISSNVAERLRAFSGFDAHALYPPIPFDGLAAEAYEPFILSAARLDSLKRVDLLLDAMKYMDTSLELRIASDGPNREQFEQKVRESRLERRVVFLGRVSESELVSLYNRCRAVYYGPIDEDYGYSAVEALAAGKPVITTSDSGGILEFVKHGLNGLVAEPDPESLAHALRVVGSEAMARELGSRGPDAVQHLNWDVVVDSLLAASEASGARAKN